MTGVPTAWIRGPGLTIFDEKQLPVATAYSESAARLIEAVPDLTAVLLRHVRPDVYGDRSAQRDLHADSVSALVKAGVIDPPEWGAGGSGVPE